MDERGVKRLLIHAGIFVTIALLCVLAAKHDFLKPGPQCPYCEGRGELEVEVAGPPGVPWVIAKSECRACDGSGLKDPYGERFKRLLPGLSFLLWWCGAAAFVGLFIWGLKVVDCRLCRGAGRLALEAHPPGESCFTVDLDCVACEGRGRLGVIDRWVLWKGWEQGRVPCR